MTAAAATALTCLTAAFSMNLHFRSSTTPTLFSFLLLFLFYFLLTQSNHQIVWHSNITFCVPHCTLPPAPCFFPPFTFQVVNPHTSNMVPVSKISQVIQWGGQKWKATQWVDLKGCKAESTFRLKKKQAHAVKMAKTVRTLRWHCVCVFLKLLRMCQHTKNWPWFREVTGHIAWSEGREWGGA